ncbi:MAG: TIGR03905 family TSCPD domain-containing protein [Oscillospiraceae bacterium]|nr:TIGR03905 family TSCPD domain-containing protein [Oscillospiraceae bacterium]
MKYNYTPKGVCSRLITIETQDGKILNVEFTGGCNGNLKGIGALVKGMEVSEAISRLENIRCGMKNTSCPDQLAQALKEAL